MQVNNLSKTLGILIVGIVSSLGFCLILFYFENPHILKFFDFLNTKNSNVTLFFGLGAIPMFIFIGMLINELSNRSIRLFAKRYLSRKKKMKNVLFDYVFFIRKEYDDYTFWKEKYFTCIDKSNVGGGLNNETKRLFGSAIVINYAKPNATDWIVRHYIDYLLATDFAFVSLLLSLFFITMSLFYFTSCQVLFLQILLATIIGGILVYLFIAKALGRLYYAYSQNFKSAVLLLNNDLK